MGKTNSNLNLTDNQPIIDLDLSVTQKKRFRFDKDDTRLVDLNIADMNIAPRLTETYPKLIEWLTEAQQAVNSMDSGEDDELAMKNMEVISDILKDIDKKMRDAIDFIFDADVSRVAAPEGTMYDVFEGQFRYEHILELLLRHYGDNLTDEFAKMKKHTKKYTKKK